MIRKALIAGNLIVITVAAYVLVSSVYKFLTAGMTVLPGPSAAMAAVRPEPVEVRALPQTAYRVVVERDLFKTQAPKNDSSLSAEDIDALAATALDLALLGTMAADPESSFAIIEEKKSRKQDLYRHGDTVSGATVKQILRGKVVLSVAGHDEILEMETEGEAGRSGKTASRSMAASAPSPTNFRLSRMDLENSMKNINQLMTQVRVRPSFENGQPNGLSVNRIRPGSIFAKMGLQNGDVIQGVNGAEIKSVEDVMSLYRNLRTSDQVALQVKRGENTEAISYSFE
ncbi:MAG: type II secretion system protein GspC [Thermodesulfobacteriota bacterium]